jgi:hypothetical protein
MDTGCEFEFQSFFHKKLAASVPKTEDDGE